MILQRKDLAKEFSLVVQQEIKNHNDLLLSSNSSIEEFKRTISELSKTIDVKCKRYETELVEFSHNIHYSIHDIQESILAISKDCNDFKQIVKKQFESVKNSASVRESYFLTLEGFKEFESKIDQCLAHLKLAFNMQRENLLQEVKNSFDKMLSYVDSGNLAMQNSLDQEIKLRQSIDNSLDVFALNFDGQKKELEIVKKRCFILEKHIENLYMMLGRSSTGKEQ